MNWILIRLAIPAFCFAILANQPVSSAPQAGAEKKPQGSGKEPEKHEGHGAHEHHDMNAAGKDGAESMGAMNTVTGGPFRSMSAIGSGTSLLTASAPGYMLHRIKGDWSLMLHGEIKTGYNHQGGPRGINKAESQNWLMGMAERPAGPGRLMLRAMLSAEPWTTPRRGFPQLLQTGETFEGLPVIDAQHAHDLLMEIAASYSVALNEQLAIHFYGGPVAEPALGPTAFMHRPSATENPAAPLSHHYQDSSHITHGVITTGITAWRFRLEGSLFHGAEPDENRKDLELGKLDSWSARLAFMPTRNWSMQYSHGHLVDPEFLDPGNLVRRTASISHNRTWKDGNWASTVVWGRNRELHGNSNSYLLESTANFLDKNYLYTRMELADKSRLFESNIFGRPGSVNFFQPFAPTVSSPGVAGLDDGRVFHPLKFHVLPVRVGAVTFGGVRDVIATPRMRLGIGADLTFYHIPTPLQGIYGSNPKSVHLFLRFRPGRMHH